MRLKTISPTSSVVRMPHCLNTTGAIMPNSLHGEVARPAEQFAAADVAVGVRRRPPRRGAAEPVLGERHGVADELVGLVGEPRVFAAQIEDPGVHGHLDRSSRNERTVRRHLRRVSRSAATAFIYPFYNRVNTSSTGDRQSAAVLELHQHLRARISWASTRPCPLRGHDARRRPAAARFWNSSYTSCSKRRQHFSRPQRPEIFDGSSVDFCSLAIRIDTGGMTAMCVLQQTGLPQSP